MRTLQSSNITSIAVEVIYDLPNHTFRDANYYPTHTLKNNQLIGFLVAAAAVDFNFQVC